MGDDFGVGLRFERVAQCGQPLALRLVVLDDAVVDQGELAVADVRVGVALGNATVRGPAGVADAQVRAEAFAGGGTFHLGHASGATHPAHATGFDHGDAGRVVTDRKSTRLNYSH